MISFRFCVRLLWCIWTSQTTGEPDEHGRTALMLAAQNNHGEVVRLLLSPVSPMRSPRLSPRKMPISSPTICEDRYRINAADVYGRTALHRAIANGHVECAKLLLAVSLGTLLLLGILAVSFHSREISCQFYRNTVS